MLFKSIRMTRYVVLILCFVSTSWAIITYPDFRLHQCNRPCVVNDVRYCEYKLTLEYLYSMEPECRNCLTNGTACYNKGCIPTDGLQRLINVYNRQLPGPTIQVCLYDEIIVDVVNELPDIATSVHWHGQHQRGTPFMDGVPMVTQCPIPPKTTFRYHFRATEVGTHFYHSHSAMERANGAYGHLIVKQPDSQNPVLSTYNVDSWDHVISFLDWTYSLPEVYYNIFYRAKIFQNDLISAILVNGIGTYGNTLPKQRYVVEKGKKYRFRFIHAGIEICPIEIKIDSHRMTVISSDGYDVKPMEVDTVYLSNGERYDLVVNANQAVGNYWIKIKGLANCINRDSLAVLQYSGASTTAMPTASATAIKPDGLRLNCINELDSATNCIRVSDMRPISDVVNAELMKPNADFKYIFGFDMYSWPKPEYAGVGDSVLVAPAINNISYVSLSSPMFQDPYQSTCNFENKKNCEAKYDKCECPHMVPIPLNSVVELVIVDEGLNVDDTHPMHLHGYGFRVVGQRKIGKSVSTSFVRKLLLDNAVTRNLVNPPIKDTVAIPDGGYVIIRFIASNPGYWFFHCHVEFHMEGGMGLIIQTGTPDQMPKLPINFPKCGNYLDFTPLPAYTKYVV